MSVLFIVNDPPYGTERLYNALRLAHALRRADEAVPITVFLMADAVVAGSEASSHPRAITTRRRCFAASSPAAARF